MAEEKSVKEIKAEASADSKKFSRASGVIIKALENIERDVTESYKKARQDLLKNIQILRTQLKKRNGK